MFLADMQRNMNVLCAFKNGSVVLLEVGTSFVRLSHVLLDKYINKYIHIKILLILLLLTFLHWDTRHGYHCVNYGNFT